jgi:hypothetical protein
LYLRFEDRGGVSTTYHVRAATRVAVADLLSLAQLRGLTPTARLAEYATFYARTLIRPKQTPPLHVYEEADFRREWKRATALGRRRPTAGARQLTRTVLIIP